MRGIENISGPLGQGHTLTVGAALAAKFLKARLGDAMNQTIYVYISRKKYLREWTKANPGLAAKLKLWFSAKTPKVNWDAIGLDYYVNESRTS